MATNKNSRSKPSEKRRPPITPEAADTEMIALAYEQARKQLEEGTASGPVVLYWLKRGSEKERMELEKLKSENELLKAKTESLEEAKRTAEMFDGFMNALRRYGGMGSEVDEPDEPY